MKKNLLFLLIITLFISLINCSKDDNVVSETIISIEDVIHFELVGVESSGVEVKTSLENFNIDNTQIENHGFVWYRLPDKKSRVDLGELKKNDFSYKIKNNLTKGVTHYTYPFLVSNGKFISGDTLSFTPIESSKVVFESIEPLNGFIGDTIFVTGKNFCQENNKNVVLLSEDVYAHTVFESDTLVKALISPFIKKSELNLKFKSCDTIIDTGEKYVINEPIFDSISSGEKYINDILTIYGKNIHSMISKVFIEDEEVETIHNNYIDKLEVKIPPGLPSGLLDVKLDVLGRVIIKEDVFQSTTPYIDDISSRKIGFLDTLKIKGNYFIQKEEIVEVFLGEGKQRVINIEKEEISVIIDNGYLYNDTPDLKINIGTFEFIEKIEQMLPPKIISFDKDLYHFSDEKMILKTKHFLDGFNCNIIIGNISSFSEGFLESVNLKGDVEISLKELFIDLYPKYQMITPGLIEVIINTPFGSDVNHFKMFPPIIESINKNFFYANEYIELRGTDFGYEGVTKVFIDNVEVPNPHNSSYTISNEVIRFELPSNITPGAHKIMVVTGGQESNEVDFEMAEVTTSNFYPTTGTRKTLFSIEGSNFNNKRSTAVLANGKNCAIVGMTNTKIDFFLPYYIPAESNIEVKVVAGAQNINAGIINGIEPHSELANQLSQSDYYGTHITFGDENNWYYLHNKGVYKFDLLSEKWMLYDTSEPIVETFTRHQKYVRVVDHKAYFFDGAKMFIYDISMKIWSEFNLNVDGNINNAVKVGDRIFMIVLKDNQPNFYAYNLSDDTKTSISIPGGLDLFWESMHYNEGKIYIDPLEGDIYSFDINSEVWENLGHPYNSFINYYNTNLYYYKGHLYLSGGRTDVGIQNTIYSYDFLLKQWKQKTPLLSVLEDHAVFGIGDKLYFGLGRGTYGYTNRKMFKYQIDVDID